MPEVGSRAPPIPRDAFDLPRRGGTPALDGDTGGPSAAAAKGLYRPGALAPPLSAMNATEITHRLSRAWNSPDPIERRRLLLEVCVPDAEFLSPHGANRGVEEHARGIDIFRKAFPKSKIVHGTPEEHHHRLRFRWTTQWNDGRPPTEGVDFGVLGDDGKLRSLVSFTEPTVGGVEPHP